MSRPALSMRPNPLGENNIKENLRPKNVKAATSKRSALGCVTNQVRVQPQRGAKDKHTVLQGFVKSGQENAGPQKKANGFAIFQDDLPKPSTSSRVPPIVHEPMCDQENVIPEPMGLNAAVAGLGAFKHMAPLAPLHINVDPIDVMSPMAIDSPMDDEVCSRSSDEFGVDPYYEDIYHYLRSQEKRARPTVNYMSRQTDVTTSMRNILVDWLVEVGEEYKLHRETLFLAIGYIDKFLSLVGVHRPKLQLVGTASMFIAAKYEEIYPPDVGEFVYITDDTYTRNQVLKMESVILKLLEFKVAVPTINWFCERFMTSLEDMNDSAKSLAFMFTELSLIEIEEFLQFTPSMIAASAVVLARKTCGLDGLPTELSSTCKYTMTDMSACITSLHKLHLRAKTMPQQAVQEKYKQPKYNQVSMMSPLTTLL